MTGTNQIISLRHHLGSLFQTGSRAIAHGLFLSVYFRIQGIWGVFVGKSTTNTSHFFPMGGDKTRT